MKKYKPLITEAKITLTDISLRAPNAVKPNRFLKTRIYIEELNDLLLFFSKGARQGLKSRIRNLMFITNDNMALDEKAKTLLDGTEQLRRCLRCRCAACPLIDDKCRCLGCVFGAFVTDCQGGRGLETRQAPDNVAAIEGKKVTRFIYDRETGETTAVSLNANGIEEEHKLDLQTGRIRG